MEFLQRFSKKQLIIGGILVAVVIIIIVIFGIINANQDPEGGRYDANSKTMVYNPPGKAKETAGNRTDEPLYLGFSALITDGMGRYQLDALKQSFYDYVPFRSKEISVTVDKVFVTQDDTTRQLRVTFPFIIDQKETFNASIDCLSLTTVDLTISQNGKKVVHIGSVDISGQPGD